jgi:hypothetical protein
VPSSKPRIHIVTSNGDITTGGLVQSIEQAERAARQWRSSGGTIDAPEPNRSRTSFFSRSNKSATQLTTPPGTPKKSKSVKKKSSKASVAASEPAEPEGRAFDAVFNFLQARGSQKDWLKHTILVTTICQPFLNTPFAPPVPTLSRGSSRLSVASRRSFFRTSQIIDAYLPSNSPSPVTPPGGGNIFGLPPRILHILPPPSATSQSPAQSIPNLIRSIEAFLLTFAYGAQLKSPNPNIAALNSSLRPFLLDPFALSSCLRVDDKEWSIAELILSGVLDGSWGNGHKRRKSDDSTTQESVGSAEDKILWAQKRAWLGGSYDILLLSSDQRPLSPRPLSSPITTSFDQSAQPPPPPQHSYTAPPRLAPPQTNPVTGRVVVPPQGWDGNPKSPTSPPRRSPLQRQITHPPKDYPSESPAPPPKQPISTQTSNLNNRPQPPPPTPSPEPPQPAPLERVKSRERPPRQNPPPPQPQEQKFAPELPSALLSRSLSPPNQTPTPTASRPNSPNRQKSSPYPASPTPPAMVRRPSAPSRSGSNDAQTPPPEPIPAANASALASRQRKPSLGVVVQPPNVINPNVSQRQPQPPSQPTPITSPSKRVPIPPVSEEPQIRRRPSGPDTQIQPNGTWSQERDPNEPQIRRRPSGPATQINLSSTSQERLPITPLPTEELQIRRRPSGPQTQVDDWSQEPVTRPPAEDPQIRRRPSGPTQPQPPMNSGPTAPLNFGAKSPVVVNPPLLNLLPSNGRQATVVPPPDAFSLPRPTASSNVAYPTAEQLLARKNSAPQLPPKSPQRSQAHMPFPNRSGSGDNQPLPSIPSARPSATSLHPSNPPRPFARRPSQPSPATTAATTPYTSDSAPSSSIPSPPSSGSSDEHIWVTAQRKWEAPVENGTAPRPASKLGFEKVRGFRGSIIELEQAPKPMIRYPAPAPAKQEKKWYRLSRGR